MAKIRDRFRSFSIGVMPTNEENSILESISEQYEIHSVFTNLIVISRRTVQNRESPRVFIVTQVVSHSESIQQLKNFFGQNLIIVQYSTLCF